MEVSIIIKESNEARINEVLNKAQGKARERRIDSWKDVQDICDAVERRVNVNKKALKGTSFEWDFRQNFPKAYKYTPESTHIVCEYTGAAWKLVKVWRGKCPNLTAYQSYKLMLSDTAKEAVLSRYE